jgi:DNA repair exonuclease SbcCD nuclease subunit
VSAAPVSRSPRPGHRVRLLHTSDLHVGCDLPTPGPKPLDALEALAVVARRDQVDAVLIAGDFFDHPKVREAVVARAAQALERIGVPVVILPGNHDPYMASSPWVRCAHLFPANVRVIAEAEGELVALDGAGLSVWGQAHTHFEDFRPAAAAPDWPADGERPHWRIAMAHGIHVTSAYHRRFSYQIEDHELTALGAHYVALGHLDEHRRVGGEDVHAYYASSPIRSGSFALVDLLAEGTAVRQVDALE